MNVWNLSDNILRLRRERKPTQEQPADFVGVTKASVSKQEPGYERLKGRLEGIG